MASLCPGKLQYAIENHTSWELYDLDDNPLLYNLTAGPFISLQDAFNSLVDSSRILLDHYVLPLDNCQLIATAISNVTAIIVCNRSYNPRDHLGTAAFVIVVNKIDKRPPIVANCSPGTKEDQMAFRSEITCTDSILSALTNLVKHFNIKSTKV